ncbi:ABC transporter ATP-binding protein [Latilactobacillus sakei]|uniref:ABC transporter ATP-binding protein n=1 Tax=Latilactobacillus sakei TaxID=1599 RepID=UPI003883C43E
MAQKYQSEWSQKISTKEQFQIMKRLFGYTKRYKKQFIGAIIAAAGLATINILLPRLLQVFMDRYLTKQTATTQILLGVAGLYALGVILKAITQFAQSFLFGMGSERAMEDVRRDLFRQLHRLGMRYFDQTPAGSIVSRVTNDTMTLIDYWNVFLSLLVGSFSIISAFIAMWLLSPKIALATAGFLPILLVIIWYYSSYSAKVYRHMREKLSQLNTKLNESIEGITIIQQFRQEKRLTAEFESVNEDYLKTREAMIRTNSLLLAPVVNLLYTLALVVVLSLFGLTALHSFVAAGLVYAFTTYVSNFFNPMTNMMDSLSSLQDGMVAGRRIFRILDQTEFAPAQDADAASQITDGRVEFKHVSFSYDGKHEILHDISFVVEPGQTVALVGHTGSGKSSIINVMMRFYEIYEGEILIDGQDIRSFQTAELRRKMGLVLQDAFMFYGDIASNIRLFNDEITDEQIQAAAEFVQADEFIKELPGQYHARVIEGGAQFSSGQRQLLSFARTLVTNPKILVLDEATANIDTETESVIQTGLARLRQGRTSIAIAHRLSTIRDAELILVLDQGQIVERGNHDSLVAQKGRYYEMYQLQNGQSGL